MNKKLKKAYYIVLGILILIFFTKDINLNNKIKNPNDILVLVNKEKYLPNDYIPNDLEAISLKYANKDRKLKKIAKEAFESLSNDAYLLGYDIIAVSAYRSYEYQEELYNHYVDKYGLEYADKCSAKPGHSEHQTGLALDVEGSNSDYNKFEDTKEFNWMIDNSYKYGFILRYPKNKENITGFKYEPWHYRYVGTDAAKEIYINNLTLEEYLKK